MIISTLKELRFYVPSCSFDDITSLQAQLDSSEKDVLKDKLGKDLYDRLCGYYNSISPDDFYMDITSGTYSTEPWKVLLLCSQRIVAADTEARNLPKQSLSVNGMGVNVALSSDFAAASEKQIADSVQSYKNDLMRDINILLNTLETWAKSDTDNADMKEIVGLWKHSNFYYHCHGLIFSSCESLYPYLYHMDNRYKFICLLPDIRFIQEEYIAEMVGQDILKEMIENENKDDVLFNKIRKLTAAYIIERTSVLSFDKQRRMTAHNDIVHLQVSILKIIKERTEQPQPSPDTQSSTNTTDSTSKGYENNQPDSKIFVSPLLY